MPLIIDPQQPNDFECAGITYKLRGLTSRERIRLMPYMSGGELPAEAMVEIVEWCLLGWSESIPAFDINDGGKNIDHIHFDDLIAIVSEVMKLSGLSAEERKN